MVALSAGKFRSLRRLADAQGRFKMLAADQRPPIIKAIEAKLGPGAASYDRVADVKRALVAALGPQSSAVLIDPDYGYSAIFDSLPREAGLLLTLEDFAFAETPGGRMTGAMSGWSAGDIRRAGADGVKLLLWYRPDAAPDVLAHQQALVRDVGEACRAHDVAFLLELLVYPFAGAPGHTIDYVEDAAKRPELVLQSLRDFASDEYGVDIYKLESPLPARALPDPDGADAQGAQRWFDAMGAIIDKPWVMLSAGAGMDEFRRVLRYAYRAGANGFLAGRAIWWRAFEAHYPDVAAMAGALGIEARAYLDEIVALTDAQARPWTAAPRYAGGVALAGAGQSFPQVYGARGA